jgi:hypothetical protein
VTAQSAIPARGSTRPRTSKGVSGRPSGRERPPDTSARGAETTAQLRAALERLREITDPYR